MGATNQPTKAVILAGGEGSRLRPLTVDRPKPMAPVGNQPMLEHLIQTLRASGITNIIITLHYLAAEIQSFFGDGSDFGVEITYVVEKTPLGTAGCVRSIRENLLDAPFLVLSADALTNVDFVPVLDFHKERGALATILLTKVQTPLDFGVVVTDETGRIRQFVEKPSWSEVVSDLVNTGIYVIDPKVLDKIPEGERSDWSGDVFPLLLESGEPLFGLQMEGYWCDIGSLVQYRDANIDAASGSFEKRSFSLEHQPSSIGRFSVIDEGAKLIKPYLIGRNCRIKRGAQVGPNTVLGDNVLVEEGAQVERSVVWDSTYIGANAVVQSAIIASRVTLKRDSIVQQDAVVGDRCMIEVGAQVRPGVKIWPDKVIERGSIVTMSVVWGTRWRGQLFRDLGVAGISNIEITPDFAVRFGAAVGSRYPRHSKFVTSRDSTRSSRMIKRALIASLLSVGLDVLDLRSMPVPVARHYIRSSSAVGAINVRKLPGNSRVTLLEVFDANGANIDKKAEREIDNAFFREEFRRSDSDDLGVIEFATRAEEEYRADFHRLLNVEVPRGRLRVVCDFGFSALARVYPSMLASMGVDAISLNAYDDAKKAPRTPEDQSRHIAELQGIVSTIQYGLGALFFEDGERLVVIDDRGRVIEGSQLATVIALLLSQTHSGIKMAVNALTPFRLEKAMADAGAAVFRSNSNARSLMATVAESGAEFGADDRGGFVFPALHPGFDAAYSFAKLLTLLQDNGCTLSEVVDTLPQVAMSYEQVFCPSESKGTLMRKVMEMESARVIEGAAEGIRFTIGENFVFVLPDTIEPQIHVYVESETSDEGQDLATQYVQSLDRLVRESKS